MFKKYLKEDSNLKYDKTKWLEGYHDCYQYLEKLSKLYFFNDNIDAANQIMKLRDQLVKIVNKNKIL